MRSSFSVLGLSVMFILSAPGQQRPNFSGAWEETSNDGDTLKKVRRVVNMDDVTETTMILHRQ